MEDKLIARLVVRANAKAPDVAYEMLRTGYPGGAIYAPRGSRLMRVHYKEGSSYTVVKIVSGGLRWPPQEIALGEVYTAQIHEGCGVRLLLYGDGPGLAVVEFER